MKKILTLSITLLLALTLCLALTACGDNEPEGQTVIDPNARTTWLTDEELETLDFAGFTIPDGLTFEFGTYAVNGVSNSLGDYADSAEFSFQGCDEDAFNALCAKAYECGAQYSYGYTAEGIQLSMGARAAKYQDLINTTSSTVGGKIYIACTLNGVQNNNNLDKVCIEYYPVAAEGIAAGKVTIRIYGDPAKAPQA